MTVYPPVYLHVYRSTTTVYPAIYHPGYRPQEAPKWSSPGTA
ncbi:hypothetical protein [Streptomyces cucumeris]|nr:hypothetical protein [Streptomyces sp. NEAU-Y11]